MTWPPCRVCEETMDSYGLQLRNNLPTNKFSKNSLVLLALSLISGSLKSFNVTDCFFIQISRAQGNWAGRYIKNICSEIYTDHEEALKSLQSKTAEHYILLVCQRETTLCNGEDIRDHTLADFNVTASDSDGAGGRTAKSEM